MSGSDFKGHVGGVLSLSEVFHSLAQNQQQGTLVIRDGRREKKIAFDRGSVTLASAPRRIRLGDLLISTGKITEDDLDLAVKLQKQNNKRLGEILVEEGFCDEEDVRRSVRYQVECELYDVFLWADAHYEFEAGAVPADLQGGGVLTNLSLDTQRLIEEASQRLREWNSSLQPLVPSMREVFVGTERSAEGMSLPEKVLGVMPWFDGRHSVETVAEAAQLSDFEMAKHTARLVKNSVLRPLSVEELTSGAREAYALGDFAAAAQLFSRLDELYPQDLTIQMPLADSLRQAGSTEEALDIYGTIARQLEGRPGEEESLKRAYQAISQIDPARSDAIERFKQLEANTQARRKSRQRLLPWLFLALAITSVGGLWAWMIREVRLKEQQEKEDTEKAIALRAEFDEAMKGERWSEAHALGCQILKEYGSYEPAHDLNLPMIITTSPPGFEVWLQGEKAAATSYDAPKVVVTYSPRGAGLEVTLRAPGGDAAVATSGSLRPLEFHDIEVSVVDEVEWEHGGDAEHEQALGYIPSLETYVAPARDGRVALLDERIRRSKGNFEPIHIAVGEFGDILSGVATSGTDAFLGLTTGGVARIDVAGSALSDIAYPAAGQVLGQPLVTDTRVIFGSLDGKVYTYDRAGALIGAVEGPSTFPYAGVLDASAETAFFAGREGLLRAIAVSTGEQTRSIDLGRDPVSAPVRCGARIAVLCEGGVAIITSDLELSEAQALPAMSGPGPFELVASDEALFLGSSEGIAALSPSGEALWRWSPPEGEERKGPCRLAVVGDRLVVSVGGPVLRALELTTGRILWRGQLKRGAIAGRLAIAGEAVVAGLDGLPIVKFKPKYQRREAAAEGPPEAPGEEPE